LVPSWSSKRSQEGKNIDAETKSKLIIV